MSGLVVMAATSTEARPLRRRLHGCAGVTVIRTGIAAAGPRPGDDGDAAVSFGLAGGLDRDLPSGTLLIPSLIADQGGQVQRCDAAMVERLRTAARSLRMAVDARPLVSVDHIVSGEERGRWFAQGYAAVDMESAAMVRGWSRFAVLRVVLDTPARELSPAWLSPGRAVLSPSLWAEGLWLASTAPRWCERAAAVLSAAFASPPTDPVRDRSSPPARRAGSPR